MAFEPHFALYVSALAGIWGLYLGVRKRRHNAGLSLIEASRDAGLTEPSSLHPIVDPAKCLGCGACVRACPEGDILQLVRGKAVLAEPTQCIGHGACATACPMDAISLVFGSASRGVDIPYVGSDFQTNVPGIFIAGELGGMGLIRNAIQQGQQALASLTQYVATLPSDDRYLDAVIVGGGPAGFAASLLATEKRLKFVTLEQESFGGTVAHFPRGKLVMTAPVELPLVGRMTFKHVSKEELLAFWEAAATKARLSISYGEEVQSVRPVAGGYEIETATSRYLTRAVLLAIGRRGTPRKLGVPGEELSKVVYRLIDPEQYRGKQVLVVGGGDSALEAAASIAEQPGSFVTLSYRGAAFQRAKAANRERVAKAQSTGSLSVRLGTTVALIGETAVLLSDGQRVTEIANDAVIVCAGGILPTGFLKSMGVEIETKHGTR